jgi:4-hydroxy-tetrahydrodipicolinate reductase
MPAINILVCGAAGKMGQEVVRVISKETDLRLVAAVDATHVGEDIGTVTGLSACGVALTDNLAEAIHAARPQVMVDFTIPASVLANIRVALENKIACVVGTTGLAQDNFDEIKQLCEKHATPCFIAPNFAISAVLMMEFAAQAARYFPRAEIIELHHDKKLDAPSGTALLTAKKMLESEGCALQAESAAKETETSSSPRGQLFGEKVRLHSIRLPGFVAHQEVIFGGLGQTLTIRHDSLNRESFMPGVVLAIRKVQSLKGLTVGLEKIM